MEKFNKAQAKNLAAAQKLVNAYASSSEDEGELDEKHILGKNTIQAVTCRRPYRLPLQIFYTSITRPQRRLQVGTM